MSGKHEPDSPLDSRAWSHGSLLRLLDVARRLARPTELQELLSAIIDAGRDVLGADRGSVFLFDSQSCELFVKIATGLKELRFSIDKGIAGECARTRKIVNVPDCYADARFNQEVDKRTGYRTRCLIAVPLVGFDDELVGVLQLLNAAKGRFDDADEHVAAALAGQAAVALQRARLLEEHLVKLQLQRDLEVARKIQMDVLPTDLPPCPGYDLAGFNKPADQTGGDIYDLVRSGEGNVWHLFLADATGHGIGPALSVTQARAMLRMALRLGANLDDLLTHLNSQLDEDLSEARFVTAFLGKLDTRQHRLEYHSAGQGPILMVRGGDGQAQWRQASTIPLGIMDNPPNDGVQHLDLAPGDLLVLLTDGFYEYQNKGGEQFGSERVAELVSRRRHDTARSIIDALVSQLGQFADGAPQLDDLTAVVVKRLAR